MKRNYLVAALSLAALLLLTEHANADQFSRTEFMVMNLNRGPKSAGNFIAESLKGTRDTIKVLDRAARQVEQVDREFAKSKGRPDDRYLAPSTERIKEALKSAQKLETDLQAAREELKSGIQHSLISP